MTGNASRYELRELRLVVEHFLEMRHVPEFVDGVAMKAAAEMIVHAARRHLVQREERHAERGFAVAAVATFARRDAEEKIERDRARKFRRAAEAAEFVVEVRVS